jgi:hypothetical protein
MNSTDTDDIGSVFQDKFDAKEYIANYYPEIKDLDSMLAIAQVLHQDPEGHYMIGSIAEKSGTAHEIIENVAIFDFFRVVTEHFLEEFPDRNARVLDIGGGPTIYQHIGFSLIAAHITHSEFLENNRLEVLAWINKEDGSYDWETYFKFVQRLFRYGEILNILDRLEKHSDENVRARAAHTRSLLLSEETQEFMGHVRSSIGDDVVHGDMFEKNLGLVGKIEPFDIITSNFVAESASGDMRQWKLSMQNMFKHVKEGGYFVQTAIKNATWYQVGKERLPAFGVDAQMITEICEESGFRVLYQKVLDGSDVESVGYDGMIFTLAQKIP